MISLLINTFNRYKNIKEILETQVNYGIVDEILVLNNGGETLTSEHKKVKILKGNWDIGLRSRWILGTLAKNDCLVIQDDDLIVPETLLQTLYGHFLFDKSRVYGVFGRKIDVMNRYDQQQVDLGEVDIVLTRLAMLPKRMIPYILEAEDRIIPYRYPSAAQFPYDDILISYCCRSVYNKKPLAIKTSEISDIVNLTYAEAGLHTVGSFMSLRREIIGKCKALLCYEPNPDIQTEKIAS